MLVTEAKNVTVWTRFSLFRTGCSGRLKHMVPTSAKAGGLVDHLSDLSDGWLQKKGCTHWYYLNM